MSDYPANIRRAEHYVAGMDAEEVSHREVEADSMTTRFSQDSFRKACST